MDEHHLLHKIEMRLLEMESRIMRALDLDRQIRDTERRVTALELKNIKHPPQIEGGK